ncbi:hypothetical protein FNF27_05122 [Cafeteria roenbergensis]|uniref:DUF4460 domain-containing protein n=2 Tax=Cafeteria roenbergensis TaxID=33653 RepID=A0A5A8C2E5_CAFRO|nr:hypothetical protein FNF29_07487 [Cafeteria roenbergensis]KAA0165864.1 hypothetical protein FNF28_03369 [Cafeteria roenbergensis]KAA0173345.1 hypothetical protein FNF27_05122 [Cafeteria roenbergensis]|eukprot:KAA0147226.1 hypothetical protein FNF29_07487 [Cafeteria roenbergensis]
MGTASKLKAVRRVKLNAGAQKRAKMRPSDDDPLFKDVFRKFMTKVHPDLFSRHPELREQNDASMQQLQEVLGQAKSGQHETEMPVLRKTLVFYVRTSTAGHFRKIPFELRTTGSDCKHVLGMAMAQLFEQCDLPSRFRWGSDYWERTVWKPELREGEE